MKGTDCSASATSKAAEPSEANARHMGDTGKWRIISKSKLSDWYKQDSHFSYSGSPTFLRLVFMHIFTSHKKSYLWTTNQSQKPLKVIIFSGQLPDEITKHRRQLLWFWGTSRKLEKIPFVDTPTIKLQVKGHGEKRSHLAKAKVPEVHPETPSTQCLL